MHGERSYKLLQPRDLARLTDIALEDQTAFFRRNPDIAAVYADRLVCIALCQGAGLHYVDHRNGIKDLDVWSFYRRSPKRSFPDRRPRVVRDFGDPRFGKSPDRLDFVGRRVDIFVKAVDAPESVTDSEAVRQYLANARTRTARLLAEKGVVALYPVRSRGTILWRGPYERAG